MTFSYNSNLKVVSLFFDLKDHSPHFFNLETVKFLVALYRNFIL